MTSQTIREDMVTLMRGLSTPELGLLYGLLRESGNETPLAALSPLVREDLEPRLKVMARRSEEERALLCRELARAVAKGSHFPHPRQCAAGDRFHILTLLEVEEHDLMALFQHMGLFLFSAIVLRHGARYMARARHEVGPAFVDHLERYVLFEHHLSVEEVDAVQRIYRGMSQYFPTMAERLPRLGLYLVARAIGERFIEALPILVQRLGPALGEALSEYHLTYRRRVARISCEVVGRAFLNFPIRDFMKGGSDETVR